MTGSLHFLKFCHWYVEIPGPSWPPVEYVYCGIVLSSAWCCHNISKLQNYVGVSAWVPCTCVLHGCDCYMWCRSCHTDIPFSNVNTLCMLCTRWWVCQCLDFLTGSLFGVPHFCLMMFQVMVLPRMLTSCFSSPFLGQNLYHGLVGLQ